MIEQASAPALTWQCFCAQRVGQHDLLTATEEKELSVKVQSLLKLEVVRDELQETLQREPTLAEWASGVSMDVDVLGEDLTGMQAARDRMISSNLRLVVSIAKRYMSRCLHAVYFRVTILCQEKQRYEQTFRALTALPYLQGHVIGGSSGRGHRWPDEGRGAV